MLKILHLAHRIFLELRAERVIYFVYYNKIHMN